MGASQPRPLSPRGEITAVLLAGAVGAGLVFLAARQGWAHVRTAAPRPLPGSDIPVTGQDLVPVATALAVAALASLAAMLAVRGAVRRLAGLVLAGFGAGIAGAVSLPVTAADAIAAASGGTGSPAGAGSPGTAGSVTAGGTVSGGAVSGGAAGGRPPIAGFPAHVVMTSLPWRAMALAGAIAIVAAGLLVAWRAARWPVMSARFDAPGQARPRPAARAAGPAPGTHTAGQGPAARADRPGPADRDAATIWESLSRGEDPTDARPG